MPQKRNPDSTAGAKLLRMFHKLLLEGKRHFQSDLAKELECSPQTVIRLAREIESVVGARLETGLENRCRWYQIKTASRESLGLEIEELRYLTLCRDLTADTLPKQARKRIEDTIFQLFMLMTDEAFARREQLQKQQFTFFCMLIGMRK